MRVIDRKHHVEGDRVVKTGNGEPIPLDEPLFLIRARDRLAVEALRHYRALSVADGCNDWHLDLLDREIQAFTDFAAAHPERMKQPSVTMGR